MPIPLQFQRIARIAVVLFILASAAFLSAITAIRIAIQGRIVEVPNLVGRKASDAQLELSRRGLGIKVEDRVYSTLPADMVVRQSPPAGSKVKVGQWAHVVLSLGQQKVSIPPVKDEGLRVARIELLQSGLQVGEVTSAYLPEYAADTVITQNPPPGSGDATGPKVDLLVSLGPRPQDFVMPDLLGMTLVDAQRQLNIYGLHLTKIDVAPSVPSAPGKVTSQTPAPGSRVDTSVQVELNVGS